MNQIVRHFIERHKLISEESTIVVGVSGGPDSIALLDYLWKHKNLWKLTIIAAHVDHMFRGQDSLADLEYVKEFCHGRDILFEGKQIDVNAYKKEHHLSSQVAARDCRYRFFDEVMQKHKAHQLALAHHGDDQVETMLMRQVRGGFGSSLAGIPVRRPFSTGEIIRPFLGISKDHIEQYCKEALINPRRDKSNLSDEYVRNRFRQYVVPFLKKENPNVHIRFQQQSEMLYDDQLLLEQLAEEEIEKILLKKESEEVIVSVKAFKHIPIPLQRRVIHLILNYLYSQVPPPLTSRHIEGLIYLLSSTYPSGQLDFPLGLKVVRSYEKCSLSFSVNNKDKGEFYHYPIHIPGIVMLHKGKIISEVVQHYPEQVEGNVKFVCDMNEVRFPVFVRNRKPGDRISPLGMKGSKKIKDLFIEEKINLEARKQWPIVTDCEDRILWVPRLKRSSLAAVSKHTTKYLVLTFIEKD